MPSFRLITWIVLFALASPAWTLAQGNGSGNADGQGNGGPSSHDNNGANNSYGAGNGDATAANPGGNQTSGNGEGQSPKTAPGSDPQNALALPSGLTKSGADLSQDAVLAAVAAGKAVSLAEILPDVRSRTGGEVIDAKLSQTEGFLLYAITALTPTGKVVTEYYYARSGIHVELDQ